MSHVPIRSRALAALTGVSLLAAAGLAPGAHAADGPVVTGLDVRWVPNLALYQGVPMVISGSGFTGATSISISSAADIGDPGGTFEVVSDHTIKATVYGGTYGAENPLRVKVGGVTSPVNTAASFRSWIGPDRMNLGAAAVTCTVGGAAPFDATLDTEFKGGSRYDPLVGSSLDLGGLRAELRLPARAAGTPDPLAQIVGNATVESITAHVDGTSQGDVQLANGGAYSFPVGTSVDGNQVVFEAANFDQGSTVKMPSTVGDASVRLSEYRASVTLDGGATSTLRCLPKPDGGAMLWLKATAPAPKIGGIIPASGSNLGGTRVTISGNGFVDGMWVRFGDDDATDVRVVSSTQITATAPAHPAGPTPVSVGSERGDAKGVFTYTGSSALAETTVTVPATCEAADGGRPLKGTSHPTFMLHPQLQPSVRPDEPVGIVGFGGELKFSAADVDAMRGIAVSDGYDYGGGFTFGFGDLPLTISGTTHAGDTVQYVPSGRDDLTVTPHPSATFPAKLFSSMPAGADATVSYETTDVDLGRVNAAAGGKVTVRLRPFTFRTAGPVPIVTCTPDGEGTVASIPVVDASGPQTVDLALKGAAQLRTIARGVVPVTGTLTGKVAAGKLAGGSLALDSTVAKLLGYGFLPVTAKLVFTPAGETTATITGGKLTGAASLNVAVPSATFVGVQLVSDSRCASVSPTTLALSSPAFDPAAGGSLSGTFTMSKFANCGWLTGYVSALMSGGNNAVGLTASPRS